MELLLLPKQRSVVAYPWKHLFWIPNTLQYVYLGSRYSAVGIGTDYGLDDQAVGVRVPVGQEFSLLHVM
jgi:hypothetical protein